MNDEKAPKGTLKEILKFMSGSHLAFAASLLCAAASTALTLFTPLLFGKAIDCIVGKGQVNITATVKILALSVMLCAVCAVFTWIMNSANNRIALNVVKKIRDTAFRKLNTLPLSYLDSHKTGETVSRLINDAERVSEGLFMGFSQFFTGFLTIAGTLLFMLVINFKIALTVAALTPLSLFAAKFIARHSYKFFIGQAAATAQETAAADEFINNLKTVKAFNREKECLEKFSEINERLRRNSLKATFYSSITNPVTRFVNAAVYAAVAFVGAVTVLTDPAGLTVGMLACLLGYANRYTKPFNEISGVAAELQSSLACAARILALLKEPDEKPDKKNAVIKTEAQGNIVIDGISFSYSKKTELLKNFSLTVKKGQKVAVIGSTGCGKTTLINLLLRFYDTDSGHIYLDGTEIEDITRKSLRSCCGMVLQDTWLKPGTVRENIVLGKPRACTDEIIAAARAAHSYSFIERLPRGLDTVIGEDGGTLSEGEKQLLCITRVMLVKPDILILDEATSSIDTRTEIKIQKAFAALMEGRTSIIVAHRLSTVLNSDIIAVMDGGRIAEQGTHEKLMSKNGLYAKLFRDRFGK